MKILSFLVLLLLLQGGAQAGPADARPGQEGGAEAQAQAAARETARETERETPPDGAPEKAGGKAAAREAARETERETLRDGPPEKAGADSGGWLPCPHCNPAERLIIDLNYYKQVLTILEKINEQRNNVDPRLLQPVHAALVESHPNLARLLADKPKPPPDPAPAKKAGQRAKKAPPPPPPKPPAPKKKGLEGLVVGHVNEGNKALGIQPGVVLVKNGRPFSLSVGATIKHNGRAYKIIDAALIKDPRRGNRHEVRLQDLGSKKIHVVPWQ